MTSLSHLRPSRAAMPNRPPEVRRLGTRRKRTATARTSLVREYILQRFFGASNLRCLVAWSALCVPLVLEFSSTLPTASNPFPTFLLSAYLPICQSPLDAFVVRSALPLATSTPPLDALAFTTLRLSAVPPNTANVITTSSHPCITITFPCFLPIPRDGVAREESSDVDSDGSAG